MQTEKNIWLRVLSMILTLALLISCVPNQVYAMAGEALADWLDATDTAVLQPDATPDPVLSTAHIVAEDESKRGETYKEYIMNNGLRLATVYPTAIHYEANGEWKDIDNTLVAAVSDGKAVYQNAAGAWNVRFPQNLSGSDMVGVTKDGHTVQFGMAGELHSTGDVAVASVGQIGATADTLAVSNAQTATAQIQQLDLTAARAAAEHPEAVLDKLNSRLSYANVYPNTNVVYDLQGNQLKESIVLQRYDADLWGYRYTLDTGDLVPVLREDQQIDLCHPETNEVVLIMPAPYMLDDNGETSYDVEVVLTQNGSNYLLSYYLPRAWLAEADRAWPVILDPVIEFAGNSSNVDDITVAENYNEAVGRAVIQCGYSANAGAMRFYMKFIQLPNNISSADVIVDATIRLNKPYNSGTTANISVHKITEEWSQSTISWANQPAFDTDIEDYVVCKLANHYTWNITDMVRDWYEKENNGMVFKVPKSIETGSTENWKQFYSSEFSFDTYYIPLLTITYQNHNGLEDYWSYNSSSAGRAGTGYVDLFTGNLVWVRGDLGFDGNRMLVSISHVYNSNDSQRNDFGMGYGWRTNYNQTITSPGSGVYVWEDGDGTRHYFCPAEDSEGNKISNTYLDEDGMHLTLTTGGSGDQKYQITDQYGNKSYFDENGRLRKIENNQATKSNNTITYTTDTGNLISTITDGAGRVYQFHYQSNLLSKISYLGNDTDEDTYISYTYDNGDLIRITDRDTLYTTYTYDGHLLTKVEDVPEKNDEGEDVVDYYITYAYKEYPAGNPIRPVADVKEYDSVVSDSIPGNAASFNYGTHYAEVTDHNGNEVYYQFNDWGNLIATHDSAGHSQFTKYALNDVNESYPNTAEPHQVIEISNIDGTTNNLYPNGGFENSAAGSTPADWGMWSKISTEYKYQGNQSMQVSATAAGDNISSSGPAFNIEPGETYTFSAYVLLAKNTNAYISFGNGSAREVIGSAEQWMRVQIPYTNEDTNTKSVRPQFQVFSGSIYVDCIQVEKAASASPYNAAENGEFKATISGTEKYINGWTASDSCTSADSHYNGTAANSILSLDNLCLHGNPGTMKYYMQEIKMNGVKGDAFVLAGWARANAAPLTEYQTANQDGSQAEEIGRVREFGLKLIFKKGNTSVNEHYVSFDSDISADHWQYAALTAIADGEFDSITIQIAYSYQVNIAYFDGIQLTEGSAGTRYEYDANKNVIKEINILGQITEYVYWDNGIDLKSVNPAVGSPVSYTYDAYHNVKTMVETTENPDGSDYTTTYLFEYDGYGNVVSTTISQSCDDPDYVPLVQKTATTYTVDDSTTGSVAGNYVHTTTDGNGKTTTYNYDPQTGVLLWVQYPEDTASTRTHYEYDEMYRLKKTYTTTNQNKQMSAEYVYAEDLLTSLVTKSTTYTYTYDKFDLRTSVKIGNRTLATYSYTEEDDGNHLLERLDYGNGNRVEYEYDNLGRVVKEKYYETAEQTEPSRTIRYYYDNAGAIARMKDSATGIETICYYDYAGRVGKLEETDNLTFYHVLFYSYDANGNITKMDEYINLKDADSNEVDRYNYYCKYFYDYKNRLEAVDTGNAYKKYVYDELDRVANEVVRNNANSDDDILTITYTYKEATVGTDEVTTYQVADKQISSDGYTNIWVYEYDGNGNIISIRDSKEINSNTKAITYEYDSANQLIRENDPYVGSTFTWTYDDAGNITAKTRYSYTTGDLGTAIRTDYYSYDDADWGDLLTSYNGRDFTYDALGNLTNDEIWTYTWQQGRQLASMTNGSKTWTYTYDSNGMRIGRTDGTTTYTYLYSNGLLTQMTKNGVVLYFTYDATGMPLTVQYNGAVFYYVTNLQGDVVTILDGSGNAVVEYLYNAWGVPVLTSMDSSTDLWKINPLRYRGYIYDEETYLYYLQSRYYDPIIGRFINADGYASTGQGILGCNMFAYCGNNPVNRADFSGHAWYDAVWDWVTSNADGVKNWVEDAVEDLADAAYQVYYDATKWHFEDRIAANGEHPSYEQVKNDENWRLLPKDESLYHMDGVGKDELKYVHPDGREAVFNGDTLAPMLDSRYMATYNYVPLMSLPNNPGIIDYAVYGLSYAGHSVVDVLPYLILGKSNTRADFEAKIISKFE